MRVLTVGCVGVGVPVSVAEINEVGVRVGTRVGRGVLVGEGGSVGSRVRVGVSEGTAIWVIDAVELAIAVGLAICRAVVTIAMGNGVVVAMRSGTLNSTTGGGKNELRSGLESCGVESRLGISVRMAARRRFPS